MFTLSQLGLVHLSVRKYYGAKSCFYQNDEIFNALDKLIEGGQINFWHLFYNNDIYFTLDRMFLQGIYWT